MVTDFPVYGTPDPGAVEQMRRCAQHDDVVAAALMADHHKGYSVPIGGVIAYGEHVSPSGVGFDIGCIAAGELVTMSDGRRVPIESATGRIAGHHESRLIDVGPPVARKVSTSATITLLLSSGDTVTLTPDHQILCPGGWAEAGGVSTGDRVAVSSWLGVNDMSPPGTSVALLRVAGFVAGDGHVTRGDARRSAVVSIYIFHPDDASDVRSILDNERIGVQKMGVRTRSTGSVEHRIASTDPLFVGLIESLGIPRGKKIWDPARLEWLNSAPLAEVIAFLGGLWSADGETPRITRGIAQPPRLIQAGTNPYGLIGPVQSALSRLGFESSVVRDPSGKITLSVSGGWAEYVRFYRTVGFPLSAHRRCALATYLSTVWAYEDVRARRELVRGECRAARATGMPLANIPDHVFSVTGSSVTMAAVTHAIYSGRGPSRKWGRIPAVTGDGEIAWATVVGASDSGLREVHDISLGHEAHNFIAGGVVVHNCGNDAVMLDCDADWVRSNIAALMDEICSAISFGVGMSNGERVDHPVFDDPAWRIRAVAPLKEMARSQLGTVGSGNHYVDVFIDTDDRVWVGCHFGSRGLGHKIATHYIKAGGGSDGMDVEPVLLHCRSDLGAEYLEAMRLAGLYAFAGRDWVCCKVARILGGNVVRWVSNHHNYCWNETHGGKNLWVVRKGSTPAFPGQESFVGGSMGDNSVIISGLPGQESEGILHSTIHGAGRVMGRMEAAGKWKRGVQVRPGRITQEDLSEWMRQFGPVEIRGGGLDEAPQAYKRLYDVLAAHGGTIAVTNVLRPIGVAMAGARDFDPYKD